MTDATMEKLIRVNVAGGTKSRSEIKAASIGDAPAEELRQQFNRIFDELKSSRQIRATGAGWHLTSDNAADIGTLRMDPQPIDLKAIPATIHHN